MRSFELEDYSPLLSAIESSELDLILVGGHAVSVYAHRYRRNCPALDVYLPFRSKDADLIGTVASGMQLASRLNSQWKKECYGSLRFLHLVLVPKSPLWLLAHQATRYDQWKDLSCRAVVESFRGHQFKVINPFLLYEAKGTNVVRIDQFTESGPRRDRSQLAIMGIVVHEVLNELASIQGADRALVKASGRLLKFWLSPDGAALVRCNLADPKECLPLQQFEQHRSASVKNFLTEMLPRFWAKLAESTASVPEKIVNKLESEGAFLRSLAEPKQDHPLSTDEFFSQLRQPGEDQSGDSPSQGRGIKL